MKRPEQATHREGQKVRGVTRHERWWYTFFWDVTRMFGISGDSCATW